MNPRQSFELDGLNHHSPLPLVRNGYCIQRKGKTRAGDEQQQQQMKSTLAAEASRVAKRRARRRQMDKKREQQRAELFTEQDQVLLEQIGERTDQRGISSQVRFGRNFVEDGVSVQFQGPLLSASPVRRYNLKKLARTPERLAEMPARWFIKHPANNHLSKNAWTPTAKSMEVTCRLTQASMRMTHTPPERAVASRAEQVSASFLCTLHFLIAFIISSYVPPQSKEYKRQLKVCSRLLAIPNHWHMDGCEEGADRQHTATWVGTSVGPAHHR